MHPCLSHSKLSPADIEMRQQKANMATPTTQTQPQPQKWQPQGNRKPQMTGTRQQQIHILGRTPETCVRNICKVCHSCGEATEASAHIKNEILAMRSPWRCTYLLVAAGCVRRDVSMSRNMCIASNAQAKMGLQTAKYTAHG